MEDWSDITPDRIRRLSTEPLPGGVLETIDTINPITEIYEFASRLAAKNIFGNEIYIAVELHGMKDRTLVVTDPMRGLFLGNYTCGLDDLPYTKTG